MRSHLGFCGKTFTTGASPWLYSFPCLFMFITLNLMSLFMGQPFTAKWNQVLHVQMWTEDLVLNGMFTHGIMHRIWKANKSTASQSIICPKDKWQSTTIIWILEKVWKNVAPQGFRQTWLPWQCFIRHTFKIMSSTSTSQGNPVYKMWIA